MLRRETTALVVHCAATTPTQDIGAAEIRKWHVEERGWSDIGYHYVIRRNGTVETGRPVTDVGAHVAGYNSETVGICLVGGINERGDPDANYTDAQWNSLHGLLVALRVRYPHARICGHRDFPNVLKACPSFDVASWARDKIGL